MSHKDAGNYPAKRADGGSVDPAVAKGVRDLSRDGEIACADAHDISTKLEITPGEIGKAIDLMEMKIIRCQLGLFGYEESRRNIIEPADIVSDDLREQIIKGADDSRVSCASLWKIADERGISKMDVTAACEKLNLKICCCQLGAFQ